MPAIETKLRGAFAPALTFFTETGNVDLERCAEHARWLGSRGVAGVLVLGSTAETGALDHAEKRALLRAMAHAGDGLARIACLAGTVLHELLDLGALASELAYDAILIAPPFHPRTAPPQGVARFVRAVADQVALPALGYCFPAQFGHGLDVLAGALATHERFVGIKESSGAISAEAFRARFPDKLFLPGGDDRILSALEQGASGSITAAANAVPELAVRVHTCFAVQDLDGARDAQRRLSNVRALFRHGDPQAVAKYLLSRRVPTPFGVRPPLLELDEGTRSTLACEFAKLEPTYSELPDLSP